MTADSDRVQSAKGDAVHISFLEAIGVGLGFLAIVAPEFWPKMPRALSYALAGIGLSWLTISGILAIQEMSGTKLSYGPLTLIILGAAFIAGGIFWHLSRLGGALPKEGSANSHSTAATATKPPEPQPAPVLPDAAVLNLGTNTKITNSVIVGRQVGLDNRGEGLTVSGSIITAGQTGNNTVINEAPKPIFRVVEASTLDNQDGTFISTGVFEVIAPYPPASLNLEVKGASIVDVKIWPVTGGMFSLGHSGYRDGFYFTSIPHPSGKYHIRTVHKLREPIALAPTFN